MFSRNFNMILNEACEPTPNIDVGGNHGQKAKITPEKLPENKEIINMLKLPFISVKLVFLSASSGK